MHHADDARITLNFVIHKVKRSKVRLHGQLSIHANAPHARTALLCISLRRHTLRHLYVRHLQSTAGPEAPGAKAGTSQAHGDESEDDTLTQSAAGTWSITRYAMLAIDNMSVMYTAEAACMGMQDALHAKSVDPRHTCHPHAGLV